MKIEEIDENFKTQKAVESDGLIYRSVRELPFDLYGGVYDESLGCYVRMYTKDESGQVKEFCGVNEGVDCLNRYTAGMRIRFSTDSTRIGIRGENYEVHKNNNLCHVGRSGLVLCEEFPDKPEKSIATVFSSEATELKFYGAVGFDEIKMRFFTLYLPLYNGIKRLEIGLERGSSLENGNKYRDIAPIVYYGSSITEGGCASKADNSYQSMIVKKNNVDYINLGFSGSAKGEQTMAEYIAALDMSVFVYDYDHNAPTLEHLKKTHYPFYQKIRTLRPELPIVFASAPNYWENISFYEPRREVIKRNYERAIAEGDNNVYFVDGKEMLGDLKNGECFVEGVHPNDLGFYKMAEAFGTVLDKILK